MISYQSHYRRKGGLAGVVTRGPRKNKACIFALFPIFLDELFGACRPSGILNLVSTHETLFFVWEGVSI